MAFFVTGHRGKGPGPYGVSSYRWNKSIDSIEKCWSGLPELRIGATACDSAKKLIYAINERDVLKENQMLGSEIVVFSVEESTGEVQVLDRCPAYGSRSSYIVKDPFGPYLYVTSHADDRFIVETVKRNGEVCQVIHYQEGSLVMFRLKEDGTIERAVDVVKMEGSGVTDLQKSAHPHSVQISPDGKYLLVCDKGSDKYRIYGVDRKNSCLIEEIAELAAESGSAPRHSVFHPNGKFCFVNHEFIPIVTTLKIKENGMVSCEDQQYAILPEEPQPPMYGQSDLVLSEDGQLLYDAVRGLNRIIVFDVSDRGKLKKIQNIPIENADARVMKFTPDGQFLTLACDKPGRVLFLSLDKEGKISGTACELEEVDAASIDFIC